MESKEKIKLSSVARDNLTQILTEDLKKLTEHELDSLLGKYSLMEMSEEELDDATFLEFADDVTKS